MSRIPALRPRFIQRLRSLGVVPGSSAHHAVGRTIASICDAAELPTPFDVVGTIPPTQAALVRRVAGQNLWLWYRADSERVDFVMVTATPPVPRG